MQKPTILILAVLLIIGGGMFFAFHKKAIDTGWIPDDPKEKLKITASSSSSQSTSSGGSGGSVSGSGTGGGATSVAPDASTNPPDSTGEPGKATTASSGSTSEQTTVDSGAASDSSAANSSTPERQTEPVAAAPKDSSPPPPPPKQVPSGKLILTESLQYLKSGQMALLAPQNTLSYPVIKPGASYSGTIGSSQNLSQADIDRLKAYPCPEITEFPIPSTKKEYINGKWVDVPYDNPIKIPIGSYPNSTDLKKGLDHFIPIMGPHLQRKLHTGEWVFTPAPQASYEVWYHDDMFGSFKIRGILKLRYDKADNILGLDPGVWYQGDIETGWSNLAFFGGAEVRTELMSMIVLGNWRKV